MDLRAQQARIDAAAWYHEFEFGNGLRARSQTSDIDDHRRVWRFIERHLDAIDFCGKSVLDIGCWDGYWSFYAERRGAKSVLASDDRSQNWSEGTALLLAKELYQSQVDVNQEVSIYRLDALHRKFDIILCLGVYYHLVDPYYAFAQIRHCCHPDSIIVFEGDGAFSMRPNGLVYDLSDHRRPIFLPTAQALRHMLEGAYFTVDAQTWFAAPPPPLGWRWRLRMCAQALRGSRKSVSQLTKPIESEVSRLITICRPFEGINPVHCYAPPFALGLYDDRYRPRAAA